ncbi:winged helix-turn-helix transcriptional regulator, partial [Streptomyces sp. NPDC001658]
MADVNRTNGGGVNLLALRSHNTALVLGLLRRAGAEGISRLELAERTGLTPQAVSKITGRLREEGLATEAGRRASTGGKPRTVLRLVPDAGHAVGAHLDRDELRVLLVDLDGSVVSERRAPLDLGAGAEAVVGAVATEIERLVGEWVAGRGSAGAAGVRALAGGRDLAGVPGPAGGPKTAGVSGSAGVSGLAGGPKTAGVSGSAGVPGPAGGPKTAGVSGSAGV